MDKIHCHSCEKRCYGEALRVQDFHFHPACFACKACGAQLAQQGFYMHEDQFFCSKDYLEKFGTRCHTCGEFVEGDVISALGNTYHQHCFVCANCRQAFPPGEQVTQEGDDCFCERCLSQRDAESQTARVCPKCEGFVEPGNGLQAMDSIWHLWCFCCTECGADLRSKYVVKDDKPFCEKDFNRLHGIRCDLCQEYIAGKVVQAGESYFHADCSTCAECGKHVLEETDVFVLESKLWHSECFPGPLVPQLEAGAGSVDPSEAIASLAPPQVTVNDAEPIRAHISMSTSTPADEGVSSSSPTTWAAAMSPLSSANESPGKRPDSQVSTGGDSAISCTTPTSSEADTPATELPVPTATAGAVQGKPALAVAAVDATKRTESPDKDKDREKDSKLSSSDSVPGPGASSRSPSESSYVFTPTPAQQGGDLDSCPSTPTPTPSLVQRTPSTGSAGSTGSRVRPKSIAGVPMRSGSSLSQSATSGSFNWKEMYSVEDVNEAVEMPLSKSCSGLKSLAHGVVSPSTSADGYLRRESRTASSASSATGEKAVSPTGIAAPLSSLGRSSARPVGESSPEPPATTAAAMPSSIVAPSLSLIEETEPPAPPSQAAPQQTSAYKREKKTYPLADLQLSDTDILLPKGVERSRLEEYLDDTAFETALGMGRDAFYKLQLWKQRDLKRKAKLF